MSITAKEVHLLHYPDGVPTRDDFTVRDSALPRPAIGEVLIENIWMSVDPYMRGRMTRRKSYIPPFELNAPLEGHAIGRVIESRETVLMGLENAAKAFIDLFKGQNTGKMLVKLAD
jgi:NADPH-dependent curcumin reductase CurA